MATSFNGSLVTLDNFNQAGSKAACSNDGDIPYWYEQSSEGFGGRSEPVHETSPDLDR